MKIAASVVLLNLMLDLLPVWPFAEAGRVVPPLGASVAVDFAAMALQGGDEL